ncbi:uncharacterized protein LOC129915304 [Episyrphus balteatus]|uniref:uncharacterized protein LOC129915304 n=1 Tax=Episyrphus balteatus TaxID=286459 RepID=UPI0024860917|nr:uncharacterized protein LOC129915304 [Episyrphus balteatus]
MSEHFENSEITKILETQNKDTEKLLSFLKEQNILGVYRYLKDVNITYRSLPYLSKDDLMEIRHTGLRAEFREKLFRWRRRNQNSKEETQSNESPVVVWMQEGDKHQNESNNRQNGYAHSQSASEYSQDETLYSQDSIFYKNQTKDQSRYSMGYKNSSSEFRNIVNVTNIVNQSIKGRMILASYNQTELLNDKQRDDLINIILEVVFFTKTILIPKYFHDILEQIVEVFPTEMEYRYYYYLPRTKNKNPRGRLYDKYKNTRAKLKKQKEDEQKETEVYLDLVKREYLDELDDDHVLKNN